MAGFIATLIKDPLSLTLLRRGGELFPGATGVPVEAGKLGDAWFTGAFEPYRREMPDWIGPVAGKKLKELALEYGEDVRKWLNTAAADGFKTEDVLRAIDRRFGEIAETFKTLDADSSRPDLSEGYRDHSFSAMLALAAGREKAESHRENERYSVEQLVPVYETALSLDEMREQYGEVPDSLRMDGKESFAQYWKTKLDGLPPDARALGEDIAAGLERLEHDRNPKERSEIFRGLAGSIARFSGYLTGEERARGYRSESNPMNPLKPVLIEAMKVPMRVRENGLARGETPKPSSALSEKEKADIRTTVRRHQDEKWPCSFGVANAAS